MNYMNLTDSFRKGKVVGFKMKHSTHPKKKWMEAYNKLCMRVLTFLEKVSLPMNDGELATDGCVTNYPKIWWLKTTPFVRTSVGQESGPA